MQTCCTAIVTNDEAPFGFVVLEVVSSDPDMVVWAAISPFVGEVLVFCSPPLSIRGIVLAYTIVS